MNQERFSWSAVVFGLVFIGLGTLFLLDEYAAVDVNPSYVIPIILIGAGLAVLVGARRPGTRER